MPEPMSTERLAEIEAAYGRSLYESMAIGPDALTAWTAVPGLLDEVERLKAEFAALDGQNVMTEQQFADYAADQIREQDKLLKRAEVAEAEVKRLKAELADYVAEQTTEQDRLRVLLVNPDWLAERARELRAINAEAEYEAEIDRLADGGEA
jgi:hypothetical protein